MPDAPWLHGQSCQFARHGKISGQTWNHSVHCPLLPGHGNLPHKLYKVSRKAWMAEAEEALEKIRSLADQVFVMGHSMGAVLGAYLASKNNDIRGIVLIAPLYDVPDPTHQISLSC